MDTKENEVDIYNGKYLVRVFKVKFRQHLFHNSAIQNESIPCTFKKAIQMNR